ncbi:hypothetical protein OG242_16305 [Streptomyces sp. NBC_00727]|uniref:hypothetical protein n=1 Tax=Streptomyces sp. NBC_00727 TaxID=2903675 RepID=UPI003863DB40
MSTRKTPITVREELAGSCKEPADPSHPPGVAQQDAMSRLRALAARLQDEYGPVTAEEQQAALDRIAAIDRWHDEQHAASGAV